MKSQASQNNYTTSKKRAFRSEIWDHFTWVEAGDPEDRKAKCNYCAQLYACYTRKNGTTNMTRHLQACKKYLARLDKKQKMLPFVREEEEEENSISTFTQSTTCNFLARMIIKDELPMRIVNWKGFRELVQYFQSSFIMPSRKMVGRDIKQLYKKEKSQLMDYIKESHQRVCLTIDMWTSNQNINYMVLTGHFVDGDWKLHKKILNVCQTENHNGVIVANILKKCLLQWGIENVFTITVNNTSSNDVVIAHLIKSLRSWKGLVLDGECIHIRCFAHILNLMVNDGLKEYQGAISKVRKAVKYVKSSQGRLQQFKSCIDSLKITFKGNVSLDMPTRWNSMYMMLENAEKYSKAFEKLGEYDRNFVLDMEEDGPPTNEDWADIREFCKFLKVFYDTTLNLFSSLHITANSYVIGVCELKMTIQKYVESENMLLRRMTLGMLNKFDNYLGSFDKINSLFFVAVLLDPRCKSKFLEHCFSILLGSDRAADFTKQIETVMERLYLEYKGDDDSSSPKSTNLLFSTLFEKSLEYVTSSNMSEFDKYLSDRVEQYLDDLDILAWWKMKSHNYPILSQIARDVLTIPISTVALESAFSCGGRIIDSYRTSLLPTTVEAIICTQSWIRSKILTISESESQPIDDYETIDEELAANNRQNEEGDEDLPIIDEL